MEILIDFQKNANLRKVNKNQLSKLTNLFSGWGFMMTWYIFGVLVMMTRHVVSGLVMMMPTVYAGYFLMNGVEMVEVRLAKCVLIDRAQMAESVKSRTLDRATLNVNIGSFVS